MSNSSLKVSFPLELFLLVLTFASISYPSLYVTNSINVILTFILAISLFGLSMFCITLKLAKHRTPTSPTQISTTKRKGITLSTLASVMILAGLIFTHNTYGTIIYGCSLLIGQLLLLQSRKLAKTLTSGVLPTLVTK